MSYNECIEELIEGGKVVLDGNRHRLTDRGEKYLLQQMLQAMKEGFLVPAPCPERPANPLEMVPPEVSHAV